MKANQKFVMRDDAVSPVIAVILMVAITVVLAAGVFVLVNQFGAQSSNVLQASVTGKAYDSSGNGATDAIELLLTDSPEAPFAPLTVKIQRNGTTLDGSTGALANWTVRNVSAVLTLTGTNGSVGLSYSSPYQFTPLPVAGGAQPTVTTWRNGEKLYIDCAPGQNQITVIIKSQGVIDRAINCDE